ncbi:flavin reductase family protein [Advenella mimigardefordensis]|uniref:Flavin reductase domain-containing protein n=1 Tax=Advenella mimigardefordensis (strain DSM 17166 / LMG 22922 / DPN7) TaxID=1247726 RepID=W0P843_ADVMD|nr:flavin reductase family protein [Advenella mimigardefordensis]AHG63034.1 flavin reductase domain-containing protein [Advenella mimigardefordensis DPN7]
MSKSDKAADSGKADSRAKRPSQGQVAAKSGSGRNTADSLVPDAANRLQGSPAISKRLSTPRKRDFPVSEARRYLEPGPIVLVSSHWQGRHNIMTMGWHCILEFAPSLFGCIISSGNHSFDMIRKSSECVINLPTTALTDIVCRIGNCSGSSVDKFSAFGLTASPAEQVSAPLIDQCHAAFECKLHDDVLVDKYNYFIFEIVKAHVATRPAHPETLHYTGDGVFMVAGRIISRRSLFSKVL